MTSLSPIEKIDVMKLRIPAVLALSVACAAASLTLTATPAQAAHWEFFDDYWSHAGCTEEGHHGLKRGEWTDFQCRSSAIDWNLWVLRP